MKTLRATSHDKKQVDQYYDETILKKLDEEQGRDRLTGSEMDAMIALAVSRQLLDDANEYLERFMKKHGTYHLTTWASRLIRKSIAQMRDKISGTQLISIANNINDCGIIITSNDMGVKQYLNVQRPYLNHIINQATKQCSFECSCTREQSKMCQLRHALDTIPGVKAAAKEQWTVGDSCPYQMFGVEE